MAWGLMVAIGVGLWLLGRLGNGGWQVTAIVSVVNTGIKAGRDVVQNSVHISKPSEAATPAPPLWKAVERIGAVASILGVLWGVVDALPKGG